MILLCVALIYVTQGGAALYLIDEWPRRDAMLPAWGTVAINAVALAAWPVMLFWCAWYSRPRRRG